ncbi:hypothetical protein ACFQWB_03405 [Paenibacillus thermoaerophilus]|uniref:Uncharacterized protein n=1 Tax=Paenibacillus thermoaerophilus TaxID=1215385 RepID=A0ABW2V3Y4_9BACL|nr:hypothetical protein [Paenibacillus thermoaerophilus]TMV10424.1 hypothetical protein FE781_13995 [Paenibacillus thermoaerophilus]
MPDQVKKALDVMLGNWERMADADMDDAESSADSFQDSFYAMVEELRRWTDGLSERPASLEAFMELPLVKDIVDRLPDPLRLNFETEAEWIVENVVRDEEDPME